MVKKYIKDGKVAVLVSHGFGAGWSTWISPRRDAEAALFDPDIAKAIEAEDWSEVERLAEEKYPDAYTGGLLDCAIHWIDQGTEFYVHEYDGAESLRYRDDENWHIA